MKSIGSKSPRSCNLIADPWVPARRLDGRSQLLSLADVFEHASEIADLNCTPPERVSLMRLLVCVVQSVFAPPEDSDGWDDYASGWESEIVPYLKRQDVYPHFELFGEGDRFLQVRIAQNREPVGMSKLFPHLASGNNSTLFDQKGDDSSDRGFSAASIALGLLTFQNFYPLYGAGYKGRGPCVDSNMIHTLLVGPTLKDSIILACLDQELAEDAFPNGIGRPLWELDPDDPEYESLATGSYLGRLVPRHRNLWLLNTGAGFLLEKKSFIYPAYEEVRESTATVVVRKEKVRRLLPARLDRALWRDLHEVSVVSASAAEEARAPLVLQSHWRDCGDTAQLWLGALVTDLKAKIIDSIESSPTVPRALFTTLGRTRYQRGIDEAEQARTRIWKAVTQYYKDQKSDTPHTDKALAHYWTALEQHLGLLMKAVRAAGTDESDAGLAPWVITVRQVAMDAYAHACPAQTPRQLKAFVSGLRILQHKKASEQSKQNAA